MITIKCQQLPHSKALACMVYAVGLYLNLKDILLRADKHFEIYSRIMCVSPFCLLVLSQTRKPLDVH